MHWKQFASAVLLLLTLQVTLANDYGSTETNEIIPREAIQKLDYSVRQALLRAIDKLEKEAAEESTENEAEPTVPPTVKINTGSKDEILEESTSSVDDIVPTVQFYTATLDEKNSQELPLASFIDSSKVWKKTLKSASTNHGVSVIASEQETNESSMNRQTARSIGGNSLRSNEISGEEIKFEIRKSKQQTTTAAPLATTRRPRPPTTTTTTTTTTPRPTHNEDGENIELVEKDDIRIQAAPLVTAFTVNLDETGAPKKVIPIVHTTSATLTTSPSPQQNQSPFQTLSGLTIAKLNVFPAAPQSATTLPTQPTPIVSSTASSFPRNVIPSGHYITKQPLQSTVQNSNANEQNANVNSFLIEKQRQLEQQIYQLKLQAQHQQELIYRQLKLLEEQSKLGNARPSGIFTQQQQQFQQNQQLSPSPSIQPVPLQPQLAQQQKSDPSFTIRPSLEFSASSLTRSVQNNGLIGSTFPVEQQLPLKQSNNKFSTNNDLISNNLVTPNSLLQGQQLPFNNPVQQVFQNIQNLQKSRSTDAPPQQPLQQQPLQQHFQQQQIQPPQIQPTHATTIQIQPSNQFSFAPAFSTGQPLELSAFQPLPQRNPQQFQQAQILPFSSNSALPVQQSQPQSPRFFRQETGTSNFGVQIQPSTSFTPFVTSTFINTQQQNIENQNFYRQHLQPIFSNQLQQNAQQFFQQQQKPTSAPSAPAHSGNLHHSTSRIKSNDIGVGISKSINSHSNGSPINKNSNTSQNDVILNNLQEFKIISKVLALNHGINTFTPQDLRFNGGFN